MTIKPTAEQKKRLRSFIGAVGGNVDVDFMDENYNTAHSASYEGVSPARVLSGITSFYDDGIKPKGNVSYSVIRKEFVEGNKDKGVYEIVTESMYGGSGGIYFKERYEIKDGKRNGAYSFVWDNGYRGEGQFVDDKPDGIFVEYLMDGTKVAETTYKNGLRDGKAWRKMGGEIVETTYYEGKTESQWNDINRMRSILRNAEEQGVSYSLSREQMNAERKEIEDKAKADGTWLKAPNGKDTNLSPEQWVTVRTKAFKEWFGDWELAAKIVDIIKIENPIHFSNIAEARRWAKVNIVGVCSNPEIGDVNISKESINKYLSEKAVKQSTSLGLHLSCLQEMPSIINSSIVGEIHKDKNNDKNILDIVRLYGCVIVDGELCRVKTTVKRYVDANLKTKAYSYEVTEIELLDGSLETHTHSADSSTTSNNSITGAKLLKGVKKKQ